MFSIKDESGDVGRCIEGDGSASPFTATPMSSPVISNLTCVGSGLGSSPGGSDAGGPTFALRDNTGGFIYNSVLTQYQTDRGGIDLEPQASDGDGNPVGGAELSTEQNFFDGELDIRGNIFFDFSAGNDAAGVVRRSNTTLEAAIADRNRFVSPGLLYVVDGPGTGTTFDDARDPDAVLDPRPGTGAAAASGADFTYARLTGDSFFTTVDHVGAFAPAPATVWAMGWTALNSMGYFAGQAVPNEVGPEAEGFSLTVGPNPARGDATVRFSLTGAQDVRLALYDITGRQVAVVAGSYGAGPGAVVLPTASLAPGVYVLRFSGRDGGVSQTVSVVR